MKIKRASEMSPLEKNVIRMIFDDIKDIKDDSRWRSYERSFTYDGMCYKVKCSIKMDNRYFTYKNFIIHYDTKVIDLIGYC